MGKYIDVDKLIGEIKNFSSKEYGDNTFGDDIVNGALDYVIEKIIPSLQQDETQVDKLLCSKIWWEEQGWIMIPPDATIKGIDSLLKQVRKKLQQEQPEVDLEKYISEKLFNLGAELIKHKPYSFNRGLNVGATKAYHDILDILKNARKEE